jgi:hypothetical protein
VDSFQNRILARLRARVQRKRQRSREAYVRQLTAKIPGNCKHSAEIRGSGLHECRIRAMGENEESASRCWEGKAAACPLFSLRRSRERLEEDFDAMDLSVLSLRWPSLGETMRILDIVLAEAAEEGNVDEEKRDG